MNSLLKVLIIASCLTLSSAYNGKQIDQMLMWSWDNCRDQLNAYANLTSTYKYKYDQQLFECASQVFESQYEKAICEDQAKIKTKDNIIKNFYYVCVDNYEKTKKEQKNSSDNDCFTLNFCKYFNKQKQDGEQQQQYIDYVNRKDMTDCDNRNCNKDSMNEIEYRACTISEKKCCEVDLFNSIFFNYYDENIFYLNFYYLLYYLFNCVVIPAAFYYIIAFFKINQ